MGNHYAKTSIVDQPPITARCPQRNRNIISVKNEHHRLNRDPPTKIAASLDDKINHRDTASKRKSKEDKSRNREVAKRHSTQDDKKLETREHARPRRKRRVTRPSDEDHAKEIESRKKSEAKNEIKKRQPCQPGKRHSTNYPSPMEVKLIAEIFNTVAELEATFLDEKKYERRLRSAFSTQIENMQHLEFSLHMEKERNKRLMDLMNRYDCAEPCNLPMPNLDAKNNFSDVKAIELNTFGVNKSDRSKWSYQNPFSNATDSPISPMLMQQRFDDLTKSYNTCQAELRRKDKLLTLAQCKQEALQAKCDTLTEQYLISQRKIESLQHKIAMLQKEPSQVQSSDSFDSEASSIEICGQCHGTSRKSKGSNLDDAEAQRIDQLEMYMMAESEKFICKTKAE